MGICHEECIGKQWILMECKDGIKIKTPFVKDFNCLAEARKCMIKYQTNFDFKGIIFSLKLVRDSKENQKRSK